MAIGDSSGHWYLINASPDISLQLFRFSELHPKPSTYRNSPLQAVFLTNADLDHVLGLFSLREGTRFQIYATGAVRRVLEATLGMESVLGCFCGSQWEEPAVGQFAALEGSDLMYRAIELSGNAPPFARGPQEAQGQSVAYEFRDGNTGKNLVVAPDVAGVNEGLLGALKTADAVLFDGTFWSSDELAAVRPGAKQAADMGHLTIRDSSLELLRSLRASKKIYLHINNTNPILGPGSKERKAVEGAGLEVGEDGMEFRL